ncbi:COMM domain-containing protein 5-like isoform X2 [Homarus americanus]|uniref:COMM domain-containing protein 5 n=1 Tax=Homarus americanus TaxID=6706 RepID=A0A8J5JZL8_HOMAM|nr:COMM domain-containing protein 5-like isoform X2 [Homarus americanus]KAG7167430.1 COMM domain-containing protein 5-like [Homarus americanus]
MVIMAVPGGVHENVIFTASVPSEVKTLVKASHNMDKIVFRKLIKLGLGYLQGGVMQEDQEAAIKNLCDSTQPVTEKAVLMTCVQYAGIVSLLRAALRVNTVTTRQDILLADLTNFGLPEEFASDVCKVVFGPARLDIDNQLVSNTPALPVMTNLNWRVEVTISTSWLSRVLEPVVMLKLETSDGSSYTFQVPLSRFHQLRFNVANLLHQIESLEKSPICKKNKV